MNFLATFYTHYGAMSFYRFCKSNGMQASMKPVPRSVSSSCGVCVEFLSQYSVCPGQHEDMESCYAIIEEGIYKRAED